MENQEDKKHATVQMPAELNQNKQEESSEITKFALGDELHKFNEDDEVKSIFKY